jgi:hypothetical protein
MVGKVLREYAGFVRFAGAVQVASTPANRMSCLPTAPVLAACAPSHDSGTASGGPSADIVTDVGREPGRAHDRRVGLDGYPLRPAHDHETRTRPGYSLEPGFDLGACVLPEQLPSADRPQKIVEVRCSPSMRDLRDHPGKRPPRRTDRAEMAWLTCAGALGRGRGRLTKRAM